jgi:hypothetical protein
MKAMLAARLEKLRRHQERWPCRNRALPGASSGLCRVHLRGVARERWDAEREIRLTRIASGFTEGEVGRMRALAQLSAVAKRRLLRAWQHDPTLPGSTIQLVPADIERVRQILFKDFRLNVDAEQDNGRQLTPRALDRVASSRVMDRFSRPYARPPARRHRSSLPAIAREMAAFLWAIGHQVEPVR